MATTPSAIVPVPELLKKDNYESWKVFMRHYLEAQDLWDVVQPSQATTTTTKPFSQKQPSQAQEEINVGKQPSQAQEEINVKERKIKNALALHALKISCGAKMFGRIKDKESAQESWDALTKYMTEKNSFSNNTDKSTSNDLDVAGLPSSGQPSRSYEKMKSKSNEEERTEKLLQGLFDDITNGWTYSLKRFVISTLKKEDLEKTDENGNTALSLAARYGKMDIVKCLVDKNKDLLTMKDNNKEIPLQLACQKGYEDVACFLYRATPVESIRDCALYLFKECMNKKMFDIVFDLLDKCPQLASSFFHSNESLDAIGPSAIILMLAQASESPFSIGTRRRFGCLRRLIYHCIPVKANLIKPGSRGSDHSLHQRSGKSSERSPGVISHSWDVAKLEIKKAFGQSCGSSDDKPNNEDKKSDCETVKHEMVETDNVEQKLEIKKAFGQSCGSSDDKPNNEDKKSDCETVKHEMVKTDNVEQADDRQSIGNNGDKSDDIEACQQNEIYHHEIKTDHHVDEDKSSSRSVVAIVIKSIWKAVNVIISYVWRAITTLVVSCVVGLIFCVVLPIPSLITVACIWVVRRILRLLPEKLAKVIRYFLIAPVVVIISGLGIILWFLFLLGVLLVDFLFLKFPVLLLRWIVFGLPTLFFIKLPLEIVKLLGIKQVYDLKLKHSYAKKVLLLMREELKNIDQIELAKSKVVEAIFLAIKNGIPEIAIEFTRANKSIVWSQWDLEDYSKNMFALAVSQRQAEVAQFLYGIDEIVDKMANFKDEDENNILHIAAKLAPDHQLSCISGAALQLQSEVKWFKAVEGIFSPFFKERKNKDGEIPSQVFVREHKKLQKDAEEWMKKTAESASVVGALIITIMFAAAFTVPGGNNQNTGLPMFAHQLSFKVFIIADAISLFAASSSVLLFFGILTSRYAWKDFLKSLPLKLLMGLSSLFISIATMMAAFCAALFIMLQGQLWMVIPLILLAGVPVTFFILLQFPLFVEIYMSTLRSDIFHKKISFREFLKREWQRFVVLVVTTSSEFIRGYIQNGWWNELKKQDVAAGARGARVGSEQRRT